jgi:hypothetical protein
LTKIASHWASGINTQVEPVRGSDGSIKWWWVQFWKRQILYRWPILYPVCTRVRRFHAWLTSLSQAESLGKSLSTSSECLMTWMFFWERLVDPCLC